MKSGASVAGVAEGEKAGSANQSETTSPTSQQETAPIKEPKRPGLARRFFWSLISHTLFASIVVAGVLGYLYQREILGRLGDELCSDARLGGYMTKPNGAATHAPALAPLATPKAAAPQAASPDAVPLASPSFAVVPSAETPAPASIAISVEPQVAPPAISQGASHGGNTGVPVVVEPVAQTPASSPNPDPVTPPQEPSVAIAPQAETPAPVASSPEPAASNAPQDSTPAVTPHTAQGAIETPPHTAQETVAAPSEPAPATPTATAPTAAKPEQIASAEPAVSEPRAGTPPFSPSVLAGEWQTARRAYLEGKPNVAEVYRSLVAKYPEIADLRGELGNILYAGGQMKEAAEQYYEAALRHLTGPQPELAACLLDVVKKIDPQRGEELQKRVTRHCPYSQGK